ncbi:MAG TPA: hypothetical protein VMW04_02520 [Patescibacteria group bacterium]|nr:hypothetical protein [Patescibacteria group bacterium]
MTNPAGNVCIRCGKIRVIAKTWEEQSGTSTLTCSSFVCPNADCQKIVEKELAKRKRDKETSERERAERILANRKPRPASPGEKKDKR